MQPDEVGSSEQAELGAEAEDFHEQLTGLMEGDSGSEGEDETPPVDDLGSGEAESGSEGEGEGEDEGEGGDLEGEAEEGEDEGEAEAEEEEEYSDEDLAEDFRAEGEPPLLRDLKAKYPKIFSEFKPLRGVLFREHQYSQIFVHPQDAQQAAETLDGYRDFEVEILKGDSRKVLKAISETDEKGFRHFIEGFLPALQELDSKAHGAITAPVFATLLQRIAETGESRQDKNLVNSVKHIASLIWPQLKGQVPEMPQRHEPDPATEARQRELDEREQKFEFRVRQDFIGGVKSTTERLLRKKVEKGLDPDKALTPFLRTSVIDKTMNDIREILDEDTRFGRTMESLFDKARRGGYSNEFRTRMIGTFLGRATQLINPIRKKYLQQALGKAGGGRRPPMRRRVEEGSGGGRRGGTQTLKASEIDFEQSSDMDILSGRAKRRK